MEQRIDEKEIFAMLGRLTIQVQVLSQENEQLKKELGEKNETGKDNKSDVAGPNSPKD